MSPLRIVTLVVLASVIGAGVAYAIVGLIEPDEPAAVAPVVIDPAAGTQRTASTTAPRTTRTTPSTSTTRPATATTRTEPEDDDGWEAGPPIESDDDSGQGRGRGRGRGGERERVDELGTATPEIERPGSSGGDDGSGGDDDSSGKGSGGGGDDD
jgi:hypothetical protein